ncbi:POT family MFS transporter [Cytophaga aurantiaca]|uniref:POT family MFS transporter n=1 Tax=Cytophaga aurantiaca TaxID=29530 RepID=UPI0004772A87|nr:POT family MFS transporter [Cytophaga aurantiaca]
MSNQRIETSTTNGMPSGVPFIVGNEAAERFSFYGMRAILAIFMTNYLYMTESSATEWGHTFNSAVYFTPILGAFLADIFIGKYRTILLLSILYCFGHLVLALNETKDGLFWGLTLISIGAGGIKPCVSAHVGDQFGTKNKHLIEKVFSIFYFAVNFGSLFSTLLTPYLLEHYGPAYAFGLPGILMFIATYIFWLGRKKFVHVPPFGKAYFKTIFGKEGLAAIGRLLFIYAFIAIFWALYDQHSSTWVYQSKSAFLNKDINLFGWVEFTLLPSQIQVANPLFVLILIPLSAFVIYPALNKIIPLKPLIKILIGMFLCAAAFIIAAYIEKRISTGIETSVWWQFLAYFVLTMAEVMVSITALEFSYTQAPNQMKSTVMGIFMFSISLGNILVAVVSNYNNLHYEVASIDTGAKTYITIKDYTPVKGEKIEFEEGTGLFILQKGAKNVVDTIPLGGTYLVGTIDATSKQFTLEDNGWSAIETIKKSDLPAGYKVAFHRFKHETYFYMYAILMFVTAVLFIGVAIKYKGKTYIQGEPN